MRYPWLIAGFFILLSLPLLARAEAEFTRDLYFGMRADQDVAHLQDFLRGMGYFTYPQSTGNYFIATLGAVKRFQQDNGLSPVGGFFGPQSRAVANSIIRERQSIQQQNPSAPAGGTSSSPAGSSPYKGKIVISSLYGSSPAASGEYLELKNRSAKDKIMITGFRVENSQHTSFMLPQGYELPGFAPAPSPIVLKPGDRALISIGRQERQINFRENICTGYFDEFSDFSPSLDHSCPRIEPTRSVSYTDQCILLIERTSACRTARIDTFVGPACEAFVDAHQNYAGCVADSRDRADFYLRRWRIWMQFDQQFFRDLVERVILRDQNGRVVDEYSY